MPKFVNMRDLIFDNVIIEKFDEQTSKSGKITWNEALIKYKYETVIDKDDEKVTIEEVAPLIICYPELVSNYGLGKFEKEDGSGYTYSIAVNLDPTNPLHIEIMQFLDKLEDKFKQALADNYQLLTGSTIKQQIKEMGMESLDPKNATNIIIKQFNYPHLYRHPSDKKKEMLNLKVASNQEGEIYTKFYGIDGKLCNALSLQQKTLTFSPYQKFHRIFHGGFKSFQSKLSEALIIDMEIAQGGQSLAAKAAEDYMLKNPEKSVLFSEKYKNVADVEIKDFQKKPKNSEESKMPVNQSRKSTIPLKGKSKKDPEEDILSNFQGEDDSDNDSEEEVVAPPKKPVSKNNANSTLPKKRRVNGD